MPEARCAARSDINLTMTAPTDSPKAENMQSAELVGEVCQNSCLSRTVREPQHAARSAYEERMM